MAALPAPRKIRGTTVTYFDFEFCGIFKMEGQNLEIRVLLRQYWKQGYKAAAAAKKYAKLKVMEW